MRIFVLMLLTAALAAAMACSAGNEPAATPDAAATVSASIQATQTADREQEAAIAAQVAATMAAFPPPATPLPPTAPPPTAMPFLPPALPAELPPTPTLPPASLPQPTIAPESGLTENAAAVEPPFVAISAGSWHTCGLRADASVVCWGSNKSGQAAPPPGSFTAVSSGFDHTCGLREDGSIICWGTLESGNNYGDPFVALSSGSGQACGLRADGSLDCWGYTALGDVPTREKFVSLSVGTETCGVRHDSSILCWSYTYSRQHTPVPGTFASVNAGSYHNCGVQEGGSVVCWGSNHWGQASPLQGEFFSVDAGTVHSCGLRQNGSIVCWGSDEHGQSTPPDGVFAAVSVGSGHSCGLRQSGSVVCWGNDELGQATPPQAAGSAAAAAPTAAPLPIAPPTSPPVLGTPVPTTAPLVPTPWPTLHFEPAPAPVNPQALAQYAASYAGGPGAIYTGDLLQLVGPTATGIYATREAVEANRWLFESDYYRLLLAEARLTNPTELTTQGMSFELEVVCIKEADDLCQVIADYFAPNVAARTEGQIKITVTTFDALPKIYVMDTGELLTSGELGIAEIGSYRMDNYPSLNLGYMPGLWPDQQTSYAALSNTLEDTRQLIIETTGAVSLFNAWRGHSGAFLFSKRKLETARDFDGINTVAADANQWWVSRLLSSLGADRSGEGRGLIANHWHHIGADLLENGSYQATVASAEEAYRWGLHRHTSYMYGPLPVFYPTTFAINRAAWESLPADLQQILREEGARQELESLRLTARQNLPNDIQRLINDTGIEYVKFSPEMRQHSFNASRSVILNWLDWIHWAEGRPEWTEAVSVFNSKIGPFVGLYVERLTPDSRGGIAVIRITEGPHAGKTMGEVLAE